MTVTPLAEARDHLSEYVADVQRTHNRVTITRYGQPAAVLISADELASLDETVDLLSTPGALDDIRQAGSEMEGGEYVTSEEMGRILAERRAREHRSA
ncbi:MAG: type II toxin-antitoxin system Phd/YefM family antitoxin [Actinomycetota bacterium]|nr:type II toxin-antitoxin system Phd/YefM family antitoxin [Actinomycetota bacterium]